MTYASDKLYNDVIKRMLAQLASKVKVREIVPYLPCLTLTDREEIEAKREVAGNYNAMTLLVDCLRRRDNWPEEFISALQDCEQFTLADEISNAYDRIRGISRQRPAPSAAAAAAAAAASGPAPAAAAAAAASPPPPAPVPLTASAVAPSPAPSPVAASVTTVTTATIHNAPHFTSPLLTPSPVETPAPLAAPAHINSPQESLPRINAPGPAEASVSAPEAPAPPPPKPAQPSEPSPPVSAPPAVSPSPVSAPTVTPSLQQNEVSFSNGAAPRLDSSTDLTLNAISEPSSAADTSLPTSTITTSLSQSNTPGTSFQPPSASEESKIPLAVTESTSSVKHPIQDTNPPEKVSVLVQDTNVSSTGNQRMETVHSTMPPNSQAQASSSATAQVSPSASHTAVESVEYFSKPGILMGEEPSFASSDDLQISRPPTEAAGSSPEQPARPAPVSLEQSEEPCSVSSDELMFSHASTNTTGSSLTQSAQHPPSACPEVPTEARPDTHPVAPGNLVPNSAPEENRSLERDASLSHNQPVEDHYESFCQSLQAEPGTLVNIVQIHEEPSVLNLNGQPPSMIGHAVHKNDNQATLKHTSTTESPSRSVMFENQPSLKIQGITQTTQRNEVHASEQASACTEPEQKEEAQRMLLQLQPDPRFIAAAAAIGVAAIFMAWKLRH